MRSERDPSSRTERFRVFGNRRPRPAFAAALATGALLGWIIVANTIADTTSARDPETALAWRPAAASALVELAESRLLPDRTPADRIEAREFATRALEAVPLSASALRALALAFEADGDVARAERVMDLAAKRSRRDFVVQAWWFYRLSQQGQFDAALDHAEAILRALPHRRDMIGPTLVAYAIDPEAKLALIERLAERPPWRSWYLGQVAARVDNPGLAYAVFAALKATAAPPTDDELRPYIAELVNTGQFEQAYLTWLHHLPPERQHRVSFAYNGDFEFPLTGLPFDWSIGSVAGATTRQSEPGLASEGHAVEIAFSGRRVAYRHLRKLLVLPPGRYDLKATAKATRIENERGLVWRVSCAEAEQRTIGVSPPFKGSFDWREFSIDFEIPHEGCRAQWLTLLVDARAAIEERISGTLWFDRFAIERQAPKLLRG